LSTKPKNDWKTAVSKEAAAKIARLVAAVLRKFSVRNPRKPLVKKPNGCIAGWKLLNAVSTPKLESFACCLAWIHFFGATSPCLNFSLLII
jgi:hypothetical protein